MKELNEEREYNKYLTEFFSNISHELKTPLNIIFSSIQLLSMYNENSEPEILVKKKEYLHSMKQNSYRLIRLINNILDMTKLDTGFITPYMKNNDIVMEVEDIAMSIVPYAESKEIEIVINVTHSGNTRLHYTDWVVLTVNGKEVKKWEYDRSNRPDNENFTLKYTLVIEEESVIEAQGNCSLHGSSGKDQVTVKLIEE